MANEITLRPTMQIVNGSARSDLNPGTLRFDQAAAGFYHAVHAIGTSVESIVAHAPN